MVGDYPSAYDFKDGRPFSGPPGSLLEQCMHSAGLVRDDCYMTNVIKHTVHDEGKFYNKKTHSLKEPIQPYVEGIRDEIASTESNIIVTTGNIPTALLIGEGKGSVNKLRGYVFESTLLPGRKVIPILSPRESIRGDYISRHYISNDLGKVQRESTFPEINFPITNVRVPESYKEALHLVEHLLQYPILAVDIEVIHYQVSCIGFATDEKTVYVFPFYTDERGEPHWTLVEEVMLWKHMARILENDRIVKAGQNFIFDMQFLLQNNGIFIQAYKDGNVLVEDTMIAHSLIYPDFLKGLDFLASAYTDRPYWKNMVSFKGGNLKKEA